MFRVSLEEYRNDGMASNSNPSQMMMQSTLAGSWDEPSVVFFDGNGSSEASKNPAQEGTSFHRDYPLAWYSFSKWEGFL
jgi:hypothetical protein